MKAIYFIIAAAAWIVAISIVAGSIVQMFQTGKLVDTFVAFIPSYIFAIVSLSVFFLNAKKYKE